MESKLWYIDTNCEFIDTKYQLIRIKNLLFKFITADKARPYLQAPQDIHIHRSPSTPHPSFSSFAQKQSYFNDSSYKN